MTTKCGFCKGAGIEPGFTECVWCDSSGNDGGITPDALKKALAPRFNKGDTDPVGDCDKFEAGIHVGAWLQRIAVYGDSPADAEALRDETLNALVSNAALREELCARAGTIGRLTGERDALQALLTAADERADQAVTIIGKWKEIFGESMARRSELYVTTDAFLAELKPADDEMTDADWQLKDDMDRYDDEKDQP